MMPDLFVIPRWALVWIVVAPWLLTGSIVLLSKEREKAITASRSLVACEARAQASLVTASQCNGHLTTCLGAVSRIADELEIERVTF